jgi:type IV pilus assembly protein PilM
MAKTGLGVTIGSHSLRAVQVRRQGASWAVLRAFSQRMEEDLRAEAGRVLASRGLKGASATLGLTGRDVIVRYNQVPPVPDWRLRNLMKFEVLEVSGQSGGEVSADYRKLNLPDPEGTRSDETVLVCLARNAYLVPMQESLEKAGIRVQGGCPNAVALFTAFAVNATYREDETSLLVHVGAQGLDVAIQRGGELLFARNATPGAQAFTQAVATAFGTTEAKAEALKVSKGDVTPRARGSAYGDPTVEKVANAMMGAAGQVKQLVESTLMIGRAQTRMADLAVERVLIAGGGASLKGLDAYLQQALGKPVERFDPFQGCDLSQMPDEERDALQKAPHEFAVALGLAQTELAEGAFRLQVVPEAVRRRRDFASRGVFAVAAGAIAAAALGILWNARTTSSDAVRKQAASLTAEEQRKNAKHLEFARVLSQVQEAREKHRRLADLGMPGVLLSDATALLQGRIGAYPEVHFEEVAMQVVDPVQAYPLLHPSPGSSGGFQQRPHSRTERMASVKVVGRIAPGPNPPKVFNDYVAECKAAAPAKGLVVITRRTFQARDGRFELEVFPGVTLRPAESGASGEAALAPWTIRSPKYEAGPDGQPVAVVGSTVEGIQVRVPKEAVAPEDWKTLLERVPATAPAPAPETGMGG